MIDLPRVILENPRTLPHSPEINMATFVSTLQFTAKDFEVIKDSPRHAAAFKSAAKKLGIKVVGQYWTLGNFDGLLVFEAPDEETATAAMIHLSSLGNVRTSTSRAFNASEFESVLAKLPQ
jgi:uncharacterized protein with GYD domain